MNAQLDTDTDTDTDTDPVTEAQWAVRRCQHRLGYVRRELADAERELAEAVARVAQLTATIGTAIPTAEELDAIADRLAADPASVSVAEQRAISSAFHAAVVASLTVREG